MRVRITFSKTGSLIYIGNLDLYTLWERAARRAGLALAYSQGFHPQPRIHFAAPLPLGFASRCELLDMRLNAQVDCDDLPRQLNSVLPEGVRVFAASRVDDAAPALQTQVLWAEYEVRLGRETSAGDLDDRVRSLLASTSIPRTRRKRSYDLRPLINKLRLAQEGDKGCKTVFMRLRAQEGATGRPDEVLDALGVALEEASIERTALILLSQPVESP